MPARAKCSFCFREYMTTSDGRVEQHQYMRQPCRGSMLLAGEGHIPYCHVMSLTLNKDYPWRDPHLPPRSCAVCNTNLRIEGSATKVYVVNKNMSHYLVCWGVDECLQKAKVWLSLGHYSGNNDG